MEQGAIYCYRCGEVARYFHRKPGPGTLCTECANKDRGLYKCDKCDEYFPLEELDEFVECEGCRPPPGEDDAV
jgi:hypothetical protein